MSKMKVMVIAVLVLVVGSLHAQTRVEESKLTNLSYVKKTYKTKYKYVEDGFYYYYSSDGKAGFLKAKVPETKMGSVVVKLGIVNVNDEVYGRIVVHSHGLTVTCNLHDAKCSVKGRLAAYLSEDDAEDITKQMKDFIVEIALEHKKKD